MQKIISRKPRVIGLAGGKGSGKDSVADYLVDKYDFHKISYAGPVKEILAMTFGVPLEWFYDQEEKESPKKELFGHTPRYLMQTFGTDWGRDMVNPSIWVSIAKEKARKLHKEGKDVVISDVRYIEEAEVVSELGGLVWRIRRQQDAVATHSSEMGIPEDLVYDTICNFGSFNVLYAQVGVALARYDRYTNRPDYGKAF